MAEKLYDIFISYSSKDQKLVEAMCHYLEERNLRCFVAYRDVPKGKDWGPFIEKGIEDSKVLVYVHTEASNMSEETTREINLAFEEGCVVIPFRVSSIKYGTGKRYRLNNVNWLDAFPQSPENYFGDLFDILKVNFPQRIQQKEDQKAKLEAERAEKERIEREKAEAEERRREAERREKERRQREEEARHRREERERRKKELKAWWERNKSKCVMLLAVIAGAVAGTWCIKNCEGFTETATETAVETKTETQTETPIIVNEEKQKPNEDSILQAEEKRQAELDAQKAEAKKLKEEQDRKRREAEKKRQAEEKKRQDENNYNENKRNGDFFFSKFLENPDNRLYKDQAIQNYERALQYKEDAEIRDRYNKLIKKK